MHENSITCKGQLTPPGSLGLQVLRDASCSKMLITNIRWISMFVHGVKISIYGNIVVVMTIVNFKPFPCGFKEHVDKFLAGDTSFLGEHVGSTFEGESAFVCDINNMFLDAFGTYGF